MHVKQESLLRVHCTKATDSTTTILVGRCTRYRSKQNNEKYRHLKDVGCQMKKLPPNEDEIPEPLLIKELLQSLENLGMIRELIDLDADPYYNGDGNNAVANTNKNRRSLSGRAPQRGRV